MIYGIGTDMVEISRMEKLLARWGDKAARRILAPEELPHFASAKEPGRMLAKRFAVKEAFAKAVGTGVVDPVLLTAVGVSHNELGKPHLVVSDKLGAFLAARGIGAMHVSITDEVRHAMAFVVLEHA
ncbi:holo-ACP synthase [uncultured Aquitalea sp.]|uniref:holo-ACP synthase n=1 Tax=uncultured Aquitalea sp. TaxID=540272 RepID=UPI0025CF8896|nr:holo-ACP synthase [uncultured Aquitalea sp.]